MKHKGGEKTSHRYWSWTHGPRQTSHGTSGRHPWRWRGSRRWFLLPAGCQSSVSWQPWSSNGGGDGTKRRLGKGLLSPWVSRHGEYIGEGGRQGATRGLGAPWAWPAPRARPHGAWGPRGGPLAPPRWFRKVPLRWFFIWFFPNFWSTFNSWKTWNRKNSRKQELALGCTELIG